MRRKYNDEKILLALDLHKRGLTYGQISVELGCEVSQAHSFVQKGKEQVRKQILESASDSVLTELLRLEDIVQANYGKAIDEGNYRAQDQLLKVHDRKVKLLGLDKADALNTSESQFAKLDVDNITDDELEQAFNDLFTG